METRAPQGRKSLGGGGGGSSPVADEGRRHRRGCRLTGACRGQYSDAVLSELESQNDDQVEGMSARVKALKEARPSLPFDRPSPVRATSSAALTRSATPPQITVAIGDEIRSSSALAEKMNDSFDRTRVRLRGTMNRMLRMAERTGVGWRVWVGFFAAVILLFWYVWLS